MSTKKILIFSIESRLKRTVHKAVVKGHASRYFVLDYFSFYALETHIMYLTVSSLFLISFVMGGAVQARQLSSFMHLSGPSRAIKFLYAPVPPSLTVWALKPPSWALVHKTTHAPMIYTALWVCIMFWMRAYPLLGQVGGGWALEIKSFWALWNGIKPIGECYLGPKKLVTDMQMHASKTLCTGLYKS